MTKIFFSWQSDTPRKIGHGLVREALDAAVAQLALDVDIEEAVRETLQTDSDTQGIPGSPKIVDEILEKIDAAAVFVADLTFTGKRIGEGARPTPNPNVLIEYGWASKALTPKRVLCVMNVAYGEPSQENMPFDLVHIRRPIRFDCPADAAAETRKTAMRSLTSRLAGAIKLILQSQQVAQPRAIFEPRPALHGESYFRTVEPIGHLDSQLPSRPSKPVYLNPRHTMWLRLMPAYATGRELSILDIERALVPTQGMPSPLNWDVSNLLRKVRGHDGYGLVIAPDEDEDSTAAVYYVFTTGEIWSVDTTHAASNGMVSFNERHFTGCLTSSMQVLTRLGFNGPYRWIAGLEGVGGREFRSAHLPSALTTHKFLQSTIKREGNVADVQTDVVGAMSPFFKAVFDAAHLVWSPAKGEVVR